MKLSGLVPNFYMQLSGIDLYISSIGLNWNLYFPVLLDRALDSTAGAVRRAGNCRQAVVGGSSLPNSTPAVEPRVHINDKHTNFQFGKFRIMKGNN
jgi:hypothetical protein